MDGNFPRKETFKRRRIKHRQNTRGAEYIPHCTIFYSPIPPPLWFWTKIKSDQKLTFALKKQFNHKNYAFEQRFLHFLLEISPPPPKKKVNIVLGWGVWGRVHNFSSEDCDICLCIFSPVTTTGEYPLCCVHCADYLLILYTCTLLHWS